MIDGFGDPYIENCTVPLNELRRAKCDASNFPLSRSCRTECLRHTVNTDTEIFESTCTAGKEQKFCQSLNILKQAP
jgi:hypothetical protein